ncbi:MAG: D-aminoacyl-tRNA deacylase [Gammaproteobacteria bacterium]|jgi:D-tyrosyl-tRNA(Tyr) deacylase|tara:strand:+ start:1394 stop:1831 length:438 start_codon:yes stop_codon:yes gene_type:complete
MKALLQRVSSSKVEVEGKVVGQINKGLLVFIGIEKQDDTICADKMINKILSYRVFSDSNDKMNLSIRDINGDLLIVSQFTLAADTKSGTRAGFSTAMPPIEAENLYNYFLEKTKSMTTITESGIFGANMKVSLVNDGPVTFLLET